MGFGFLGGFRVNLHRGADVLVSHDVLNDLQVGFIFTQPGAECVPEIMAGERRQQLRLPLFLFGLFQFGFVVCHADALDGAVDRLRVLRLTEAVQEHKVRDTIDFVLTHQFQFLLIGSFLLQRFSNFRQYGNCPLTGGSLGGRHGEIAATDLVVMVHQIVLDGDKPTLEVDVTPAQANRFRDAASGTQHEGEHREPMLELRRFLDEIQKRLLLGQGQSVAFGRFVLVGGFYSRQDTIRGIHSDVNFALAVVEVERTLKNVGNYKSALLESPERELTSMVNALNGGYTQPSPGGDPIANPNTLPTGRNLFAINAEETPSESAWEKGKQLADNTIEMYRRRHNDSVPRKVSYTLWSGEFIETGGATIAQVLYMLGVEPVRDTFGRVTDLRLIPSAELGRPRIDVVVQTSGQLRDIAASRLFLINRAVEMAANAREDQFENQVAAGVVEAERVLIEKGLTPKEAREMSTFRVFGGVNGNYGTGIQSMVQSGDRWESEEEIADVYLNNMGAFYGSEKNWETVRQFALEAALTRTDAVIQPRQSNTWGALSLDHVYEFMGGMNLAVRNVTGKDPDAYLSDYRNRNNARMQEVKEAIGIESRTTIFNPAYIKEKMKGEAGAANTFAEIVQNTYGWNVMKPQAVDKEMWNEIYDVYVKDKFNLGVQGYFEKQNPAALEEMTAVMMETIRKGMWQASGQQIADIAKLHTDLVNKYKPSCSGFVCDNAKLRQFIASKMDAQTASRYKENISQIREVAASKEQKGMVMKKEEMNTVGTEQQTNTVSNTVVCVVVVAAVLVLIVLVRCRRKKMQE